jgi:hypothetical protein
MAKQTLAARVAALETQLAQLQTQLAQPAPPQKDWLDEWYGAFADDPLYDEAMRLGREYRESLRPKLAKKSKRANAI